MGTSESSDLRLELEGGRQEERRELDLPFFDASSLELIPLF